MKYFFIIIILGIFLTDLKGWLVFSDISFLTAVIIYILFVRKWSFELGLFFLTIMIYFYTRTGVTLRVERTGEWFYIFSLVGLIQYCIEVCRSKK